MRSVFILFTDCFRSLVRSEQKKYYLAKFYLENSY
jgi:hypothetical protein